MRIQPLLLPLGLLACVLGAPMNAASAQCLSSRNSSSNGTGGDRFGRDVASSGNDLLIGASRTDRNGQFSSGSVYRYLRTPSGYVEQEEWVPFDSGSNDFFGEALDLDGDWAAIGAFSDDDNWADSGSVYLWQKVGSAWIPGQKLAGSQTNAGDKFGTSLAIAAGPNPRLAIGSPWHANSTSSTGGAVYLYDYDSNTSTWIETQIVQPTDNQSGDFFGSAVALDGNRLVVGASAADPAGSSSGAVYVFEFIGGLWSETAKLVPADLGSADFFGRAVALDGDRLAATGRRAYVFDFQGSWTLNGTLVGAGTTGGFGKTIDVAGDHVLVTEYYFGSNGGAWLFSNVGGNWMEAGRTNQQSSGDYNGRSATFAGDEFIVTADSANTATTGSTAGEFYTYPYAGPDCNSNGVADACDIYAGTSMDNDADGNPDECGGNPNYCSSTANSSGGAAVISFNGSESVANNNFILGATTVPNTPGIFFYGQSQADLAFGNGRLCVGSPQFRLPAVLASVGQANYGYDLTAPPLPAGLITPGSTWNFQYWFRDPGVGAGFDTSDGLSVSFTL